MNDMHSVVERVGQLPALSGVIASFFRETRKNDPNANAIGRLIGQDPGIAARVLRVANSPFYGCAGHIGTLSNAVVVLGLDNLRGVILAAGLINQMHAQRAACLDVRSFWRDSLAAANTAQAIATAARLNGERAFLTGLLHRLGEFAYALICTNENCKILQSGGDIGCCQEIDFNELGAALASRWHFPDDVVAALVDKSSGKQPC